jgi:ABC-type Fe3+ transport system permease subunit
VPAVLLGIGLVKTFNHPATQGFYNGTGLLVAGMATRFLPFAVLTLAATVRRIPPSVGEAALLTGRGALARGLRVHLPLLAGALWSLACLLFVLALRELDLCVVVPAGNDTVVRRLANIVHFGGEAEGGALAVMLLLIAVLVPIATMLLTGRRMRSLS